MNTPNPVFNNQVKINDNTISLITSSLKKKIVAQLSGKTVAEQEKIIEALLKLLDVNLLAALDLAYSVAPEAVKEEKTLENTI